MTSNCVRCINQWIKTYAVSYGWNPESLTLYDRGNIFKGNREKHLAVKHIFNPPIEAKYIRVLMKSWHWSPVMRMELYGCVLGNYNVNCNMSFL